MVLVPCLTCRIAKTKARVHCAPNKKVPLRTMSNYASSKSELDFDRKSDENDAHLFLNFFSNGHRRGCPQVSMETMQLIANIS